MVALRSRRKWWRTARSHFPAGVTVARAGRFQVLLTLRTSESASRARTFRRAGPRMPARGGSRLDPSVAFRVEIAESRLVRRSTSRDHCSFRDQRAKDSVFQFGGPFPGDRIQRQPIRGNEVARRVNGSCRRFRSSKIFVRRCRCRERAEAGVTRFFLQQIAYASQGRSPNRVRSNHQRVTSRRVIRRGF